MTPAPPRSHESVDVLRRRCAVDAAGFALPFARALNAMALDYGPLPGAVRYLDEAAHVVRQLMAVDGATPSRTHHLVMILSNRAQFNALSGGFGWSDLAKALDSSTEAVDVQREAVRVLADTHRRATYANLRQARASFSQVLLVHARVQAACALTDEAAADFREAEAIIRADALATEWGDSLRTVGAELGIDVTEWGGPLAPDDRVARWYWYAP